jgi:antitoxin component HigA of HigAB toxin-antitoxin module
MEQHGVQAADLVPLLGTAERVDDVLRDQRQLLAQGLRARFQVPADLLLPPVSARPPRRRTKKAVA